MSSKVVRGSSSDSDDAPLVTLAPRAQAKAGADRQQHLSLKFVICFGADAARVLRPWSSMRWQAKPAPAKNARVKPVLVKPAQPEDPDGQVFFCCVRSFPPLHLPGHR